MFDFRIVSEFRALAAIAVCLVFAAGLSADDTATNDTENAATDLPKFASTRQQWKSSGWPLLEQFCLDCHNEDLREGELDLSSFESFDALQSGASSMQRVLEMVRFGAMPPEDYDLPTDEQRKALVQALDQTLYSVSCDLRPRPGKVTARRLNKAEYNNTIRDMFGMDLKAADAFPSDDVGAGFDNNSDVLSLSPLLIEKYLAAAEDISEQVLIDPAELPNVNLHRPSDQMLYRGDIDVGTFNGLFIKPDTIAWTSFDFPARGKYRFYFSGGSPRKKQDAGVAIYDDDGLLVATETFDFYGGSGRSKQFSFDLDVDKGKQTFYLRFADSDDSDENVGDLVRPDRIKLSKAELKQAQVQSKQTLKPNRRIDEDDFALMIRKLSVYGPREFPDGIYPPSQYKIARKTAKKRGSRWSDVEPAARGCLEPLMRVAFRRPVTSEEVAPYVGLVVQTTERGESYHRGLQIAISAILVSPNFLFRVETPGESALSESEDDGSVAVSQHQLASRLSYFLWSSMPDEELLRDADKGKLKDDRVDWHVRRMLRDPKSAALSNQFASQWLGLRNLDIHEADRKTFPQFTDSLKSAMLQETQILFSHLLREGGGVSELLTADYSFVNQELADHYGIEFDSDDAEKNGQPDQRADEQFRKVSLADTPRRGILSHASFLTLTSNPTRTSPVKRGKWILENVLGTPPPEPPVGVPELEDTETAADNATLREQLELHRADPSCAACHRVMDQLGFGLEQFDAIGGWRTHEGALPIDSSGELPGGRSFGGARELSDVLGRTESLAFAKTVTERLMTFALGRELSPTDRCVIDEIAQKTEKDGHRLSDLILQVTQSRQFRFYDWDGPHASDQDDSVATSPSIANQGLAILSRIHTASQQSAN